MAARRAIGRFDWVALSLGDQNLRGTTRRRIAIRTMPTMVTVLHTIAMETATARHLNAPGTTKAPAAPRMSGRKLSTPRPTMRYQTIATM